MNATMCVCACQECMYMHRWRDGYIHVRECFRMPVCVCIYTHTDKHTQTHTYYMYYIHTLYVCVICIIEREIRMSNAFTNIHKCTL
jgi:hypothetical protein